MRGGGKEANRKRDIVRGERGAGRDCPLQRQSAKKVRKRAIIGGAAKQEHGYHMMQLSAGHLPFAFTV